MNKPIFQIPSGDYVYNIYPAFIIAIFVVVFIFIGIMAAIMLMKNKKRETAAYRYYEITDWQRKNLVSLIKKHNEVRDEYKSYVKWIQDYMNKNKYWNMEEILEDSKMKQIIVVLDIYMLETSMQEYILGHLNNAVLMLHAMDFLNGGMEGDIYESNYEWIGNEIESLKNHTDMTEEEARTLYLFASAVITLLEFCDEDLEKIPEDVAIEEICKSLTLTDMELAADEIDQIVDIRNEGITDETRDVITRSLYSNMSIMVAGIFDDGTEYLDEYRRFTLRALVACIDKQLYSEFIETIE